MFTNLPLKARPKLDLPRETRATCSTCVMARADWPRDARDPGPFAGDLKCCTYEPFLPNFSIGKVLLEGGTEGKAALEKVILAGDTTPLGLVPRREAARDFGRDTKSRCVFLAAGRCSIWTERPSVCRSYYCVSDRGAEGQALWARAEALGNEAEWTLAHEILWDMGFTQDETATFAEWAGREREFFIECARRAFGESFNRASRV